MTLAVWTQAEESVRELFPDFVVAPALPAIGSTPVDGTGWQVTGAGIGVATLFFPNAQPIQLDALAFADDRDVSIIDQLTEQANWLLTRCLGRSDVDFQTLIDAGPPRFFDRFGGFAAVDRTRVCGFRHQGRNLFGFVSWERE